MSKYLETYQELFFAKLQNRVNSINSLLCIGLDPHVSQLPSPTAEAAFTFCKEIVEETLDYAAAYKPNIAFFECFGADGFAALKKVMECIPNEVPIILDCKRGDIDTTAQAYATASYEIFNADSVTLSPYMGWDSLAPFITGKYSTKGAFILCKTSNPSSKDLQLLTINNSNLYQEVARISSIWNKKANEEMGDGVDRIGLVVGATDLIALQNIRHIDPNVWMLCPGVGAQGGAVKDVCEVGLRSDGSGLLIAVSRVISKANDKKLIAKELRDEINLFRQKVALSNNINPLKDNISKDNSNYQNEFISFAISKRVLQFGSFTLKSGRTSPYFFNAGLFNCGMSMSKLSRFYAQSIKSSGLLFDVIFGPAYKGIPLAASIAMAWYEMYGEVKDFSYNRKEIKDHGEGGSLVGASVEGRRVLIVDDVITAGTAIREAVDILHHANAEIVGVTVCLDRQEKISNTSTISAIQEVEATYGFPVLSIIKLTHLIEYVKRMGNVSNHLAEIEAYRLAYGVDS